MNHPFPAEHDQQQAEALDILRGPGAFVLLYFSDGEAGPCTNPLCTLIHEPHRTCSMIASCSTEDLRRGMSALAEEILLTNSIEVILRLDPNQRAQVAALLQEENPFLRLRDDDDED